MWGLIERLRHKPRAVRNQASFVGALVCMICVFGVWSMSVPSRLNDLFVAVDAVPEQTGPSVWSRVIETPQSLLSLVLKGKEMIDGAESEIVIPEHARPASTDTTVTATSSVWQPRVVSSSSSATFRTGTPVLIATSSAATSTVVTE